MLRITRIEEIIREAAANGITKLVLILDRSGSMSGLEKDTESTEIWYR